MEDYRHILLATDFSPACEAAAQRAAALAARFDAQLTALHVVDYFPEDIPIDRIAPEDVDPATFLVNQAREALKQLAERVARPHLEQEVLMSTHSAKHEIIRFAKDRQVDLIVLGSHGRRGIGALLGSTVDGALHQATVDVLVVRAQP